MRYLVLCALLCGCGQSVRFPADSHWPAATVPDWVHQPRFAVTDNLSDELSYVSATEPVHLADVPIGDVPVELEGPHHLAASPDGKYIYYNLSNLAPGTGSGPHGSHGNGDVPGTLVKLDAQTTQKLGEAPVDRSPGDVILSKDGKWAFVSHYDLLRVMEMLAKGGPPESGYSAVAIIDTATMRRVSMTPVCPTAHGEGLSADEKTLYVTCALSDELAILDISDKLHPKVTARLKVGPAPGTLTSPAYSPYALTVSPVDGRVWVSDNTSGDVRVYDPAQGKMDDSQAVKLDGVAMFGAFGSDGKTFYVPTRDNAQLAAIDVMTLQKRVLPLPPSICVFAHAFVLTPDGQTGVLVCEGNHPKSPGSIVYVNVPAFTIIGSVTVGMFSDGAAWLPAL